MYMRRVSLYTITILLSVYIFGCTCNIKITQPSQDGQFVTEQTKLRAAVGGRCTECQIESFRAYLDNVDITDEFVCNSQDRCIAQNISLPFGPHILKVDADLHSDAYWAVCRVGSETDIRHFYVTRCNNNGICETYENMESCIGDCWNPYNYDTSYNSVISIFDQDIEHLCTNDFCTVTDLDITCGNLLCDENEKETTCPQDCNCFDDNNVLDRSKGFFGGESMPIYLCMVSWV